MLILVANGLNLYRRVLYEEGVALLEVMKSECVSWSLTGVSVSAECDVCLCV